MLNIDKFDMKSLQETAVLVYFLSPSSARQYTNCTFIYTKHKALIRETYHFGLTFQTQTQARGNQDKRTHGKSILTNSGRAARDHICREIKYTDVQSLQFERDSESSERRREALWEKKAALRLNSLRALQLSQ